MSQLQYWLLGSFQVWRGDMRLDLTAPGQRARTLLALLLTERGHYVPAERLIDALWSHLEPATATNNLQVTVRKLRRWLEPDIRRGGDSHYLLTEPAGYRLLTAGCVVDVDDFLQAIQRGQAARRGGDLAAAQQFLEGARALYRGDFLGEYPYADWAWATRERLREAHLQALETLGDTYLELGLYQEAAAVGQQGLAVDPLREPFTRLLMRGKAALGQRGEALVAYDQAERTLAAELGVRPSTETRALREAILSGAVPDLAPAAPSPAAAVELPLVGRAGLLQALQAAWRRRDQVVLLSGEAGAGKSRLLAEFAAAVGSQVFLSQARENDPPFTAVLNFFEAFLRRDPPVESLASLGVLGAPLAQRLPSLRHRWPDCPADIPLPAAAGRARLQQAAVAAVRLAAAGPTLFLLDDLHWAGEESLAVLAELFRHPSGGALFALAYRSEEAGGRPLAAWLAARRQQEAPPLELELAPLSAADVFAAVQAITGLPDPLTFSQRLHEVTGGHALFLTETLRGLREAGWLYRDAGGVWQAGDQSASADMATLPLTPTLREAVLARAGRLEPFQREVLDAAAVLRPQIAPPILVAILQSDPGVLHHALRTLAGRRLLLPAGGDTWEFSHHLLGEVIYAGLAPTHRRLLHRLAAAALMAAHPATPGPAAAGVVTHLQQGMGEGEALLVWATRAGQWAYQQFAYAQACDYFELALAQLERLPDDAFRAALALPIYEGLGLAQQLTGRIHEALRSLETALTLAARPEDRVRLLLALARICERDTGEYDRAMALLDEAEAMLAQAGMENAGPMATIRAIRAYVHYWRGQHLAAERLGRQAAAEARSESDRSLAVRALANSLQKLGRVEEAVALFRDLLYVAETAGDRRGLAQAYLALSGGLAALGQLREAQAANEQAGDILARLGDLRRLSVRFTNHAIHSIDLGDLRPAVAGLKRAVELALQVGAPYTVAVARHSLGRALALRGRLDEAQAEFEAALALARSINARVIEGQARVNFAWWHWARGDAAGAELQAQAALETGDALGDNFCQRESRLLLGTILLAAGEVAAANAYARDAYRLAAGAQQVLATGRAARLLAQVAVAGPQPAAAADHLVESERIFRQAGAQIELGQTLLARAAAARRLGRPAAERRAWLLEARRLFRRAGARPLLKAAEKRLREP